jgi:[protein-PII] uridylyltransferase
MWFRVAAPPSAARTSASELARRLTESVTGESQQNSYEQAPLVNRRDEAIPVQTRVRILPGDSPFYTVLEIRCRDRKGLVRDLAHLFENLGLTVEYALVTTHGPMAQDTFHLKDIFGGRVDGAAKLQALVEGAEEVAKYAA